MTKSKQLAISCLVRAGGIAGALSLAALLSLFALCGYLHFGLSLSWTLGLSLLCFVVCPLMSFVFPDYFAALLATSLLVWWIAEQDAAENWSTDTGWWLGSGLLAIAGLFSLVLALFFAEGYQLSLAGVLIGQYMLCILFVVRSWRSPSPGAGKSDRKLPN